MFVGAQIRMLISSVGDERIKWNSFPSKHALCTCLAKDAKFEFENYFLSFPTLRNENINKTN